PPHPRRGRSERSRGGRRAEPPRGRALGRGQRPPAGERARSLGRPAAAPLHRPGHRRRAGRPADGRAVLGARSDRDREGRGADARAEEQLYDRDRDPQYATGGPRLRLHWLHAAGRAGRGRRHAGAVHEPARQADRGLHHRHVRLRAENPEPQLKPYVDLPRMAEKAQRMVKESLDAFVSRDTELARRVCGEDADVDALKEQIFRELLTYMMEDPKTIPRAIRLILVSRFLERVADHATNIAEMVIYLVESKMVRHMLA